MNGIVLQIVCHIAFLASFDHWSETSATPLTVQPTTGPFSFASSTTFDPIGTPCEGVSCSSGKHCALDENFQASCVCDSNCDDSSYIPVCGSDSKTYPSYCAVVREACITNNILTVDYYGECGFEVTTCDGLSCPKGMQCAIDERKKLICVCIDECPYTNDIVCGSDGRTYGSECQLYRETCASNTGIRVAYKGHCIEGSVCVGFPRCPKYMQCSVNQDNQPVCICRQLCPDEYDPVCGSNGVSFYNLCQLEIEACTTGTNLTMVRKGKCVFEQYCYDVSCTSPKICVVDEKNQTSCVCNSNCENEYYPVCGSDGKTYDNYCRFYYAACQANLSTDVYTGVCSLGPACLGASCSPGEHCDSQSQPEPKCVCHTDCSTMYSPVCGSNNKTYINLCERKKDACLTESHVWTNFNGRCEDGPGCTQTYCPYDQICVVDERNQPMCVCSLSCGAGSPGEEVCGTDGKTYTNDCQLQVTACMTKKAIAVQRYSPCRKYDPCDGVVCSTGSHCQVGQNGRPICVCTAQCPDTVSPVCGSDNKTYSNLCEIQKAACLGDPDLRWMHYGSCVETSICDQISCPRNKRCTVDERNNIRCSCIDQCIRVQDPVCASDGRTHHNECEIQMTACFSNTSVTVTHKGKCDEGPTCSDIICPTGQVCSMNEDRTQWICVCRECTFATRRSPVCGTDGKTYDNICYLEMEACRTNIGFVLDYAGPCRFDARSTTPEIPWHCVGAICGHQP